MSAPRARISGLPNLHPQDFPDEADAPPVNVLESERIHQATECIKAWFNGIPDYQPGQPWDETLKALKLNGFEIIHSATRPKDISDPDSQERHFLLVAHRATSFAGTVSSHAGLLHDFQLSGQWSFGVRQAPLWLHDIPLSYSALGTIDFLGGAHGIHISTEVVSRDMSFFSTLLNLAANADPIPFSEWTHGSAFKPYLPRGLFSAIEEKDCATIEDNLARASFQRSAQVDAKSFINSLPEDIRALFKERLVFDESEDSLTENPEWGNIVRSRCAAAGITSLTPEQQEATRALAIGLEGSWIEDDFRISTQRFVDWAREHGARLPAGLNPLHALCSFWPEIDFDSAQSILAPFSRNQLKAWAHERDALGRSPLMIPIEMRANGSRSMPKTGGSKPMSPSLYGALLQILGPDAFPPHDSSFPSPMSALLEDTHNSCRAVFFKIDAAEMLAEALDAGALLQPDGSARLLARKDLLLDPHERLPWSHNPLFLWPCENVTVSNSEALTRLSALLKEENAQELAEDSRRAFEIEEAILRLSCAIPSRPESKPLAL